MSIKNQVRGFRNFIDLLDSREFHPQAGPRFFVHALRTPFNAHRERRVNEDFESNRNRLPDDVALFPVGGYERAHNQHAVLHDNN